MKENREEVTKKLEAAIMDAFLACHTPASIFEMAVTLWLPEKIAAWGQGVVERNAEEEAKIKAVKAFVDTIEATDGVRKTKKGWWVPVVDEEWVDLGEAYMAVCHAFGIKPVVKGKDADEEKEGEDEG